jgi:hypothetical protein
MLLVGNHQTLALDLGLIAEQFLREKSILPRGLAHPVIFAQSFGEGGGEGASAADVGVSGPGALGSGPVASGSGDLPAWDPINSLGATLTGGSLGGS